MKQTTGLLLCCLAFLAFGCNRYKEATLTGHTMGTTYHIKVLIGYFDDPEDLQQAVDQRLDAINQSMSIFRPDSEISQLNSREAHKPMRLSDDFFKVLVTARQLHRITGGAWDGTVEPLIEAWGFGKTKPTHQVLPEEQIQTLLNKIGFDHITFDNARHTVQKAMDELSLNLGSIAKGYGVDQIAQVIETHGFQNYLVEIGGEVYAAGKRLDGGKWRIGINRPDIGAPFTDVYKVVELEDGALATSGDYRNFFEKEGKIYSHVIDPQTGYPVSNQVVSVTIVAETCTIADGLATAVMVMGPEKGLKLINQLPNIEGLIITMQGNGRLMDHFSTGFQGR